MGECGLHGGPHGHRRCTEREGTQARYAKGWVRLATAHLCRCEPPCMIPHHVRAMCQRCHLRYDRFAHAAARARNAALEVLKHRAGQGPPVRWHPSWGFQNK